MFPITTSDSLLHGCQLVSGNSAALRAANPNRPITFRSFAACPKPAVTVRPMPCGSIDLFPKANRDRNARMWSTGSALQTRWVKTADGLGVTTLRTGFELFYDFVSHDVHSLIVNGLVRLGQRSRAVSSRLYFNITVGRMSPLFNQEVALSPAQQNPTTPR